MRFLQSTLETDYGDNFAESFLISFHLPRPDEKFAESLTFTCRKIKIVNSRPKSSSFKKFSREPSARYNYTEIVNEIIPITNENNTLEEYSRLYTSTLFNSLTDIHSLDMS